ncbi:MAG: hypothetical protein JWN96_1254 [Mycobacterium sp.]|nr:hypothetical protein [Mycobacterium sp.]
MIVTGAFLAEHADAVDGKLDVRGGVVSRYVVGADRIARFFVVVLTQAETDNTDRGIVVDVLPPAVISDEPLRVVDAELPAETTKAEIGFAVYRIGVTMRFNGRWRIVVTAAGGGASLPLNVRGPNAE